METGEDDIATVICIQSRAKLKLERFTPLSFVFSSEYLSLSLLISVTPSFTTYGVPSMYGNLLGTNKDTKTNEEFKARKKIKQKIKIPMFAEFALWKKYS